MEKITILTIDKVKKIEIDDLKALSRDCQLKT